MDIPADPLLGLTAEAAREEPDFGHRFVAMDGFGRAGAIPLWATEIADKFCNCIAQ